jgi:hypothetical protein
LTKSSLKLLPTTTLTARQKTHQTTRPTIAKKPSNHVLITFFFLPFSRKSGDNNSGSRQIRNTPDWSDNAVSGDHLWVPTSVSGDCCYVGDSDCTVCFKPFTPSHEHEDEISIENKIHRGEDDDKNPLW